MVAMHAAMPILYSFRRCPYAMRARLALCQAGVSVVLREVDLRNKPAALLAISPAATVPVLDGAAATVLVQSLDIMRWALHRHDPAGWLTRGDPAIHQQLVDANDGVFKQALDRYKYANRHPERSQTDYRADAVACLIEPLEAALADSGSLGGDQPCWADAAIFPFVRQFAAVDPAWFSAQPLPALQAWLTGWLAHPLFNAAMARLPTNTVVIAPTLQRLVTS